MVSLRRLGTILSHLEAERLFSDERHATPLANLTGSDCPEDVNYIAQVTEDESIGSIS